MKNKIIFLLCFFVGIGASFSQMNPTEPLPFDPSIRKGTLDNGLTYFIKKNSKPENKVELRLAVNAGSVLEDEDQLGLAHFMEHMNFNGTKNFPDNELVDFLQSIGVKFGQHLNAYTSFDETVYMLPVPLDKPDNLDNGLLVIEDWAFNAQLTDEQIEKERGVVLEELRLGLGPDKRMLDRYLPKLMNGSLYADRLPIGAKEIIENFKPEVLRRFYKDWYRPDLMAVIVVGDIDVDEIEKKIKTNFGKYKNPKNPRERKVFNVPNNNEPLIAIESDPDASFSRAQMLIKDTEDYKPDPTLKGYMKDMAASLVTTMINNRIQELVDSKNPPFTYGSVYYGSTWARTKNALQAFAMTKEGEQDKGIEVIYQELERAKKHGFLEAELDRAKNEYLTRLEKAYNDRDKTESSRHASELVRHFLEGETVPGIEWEYNTTKQMISFLPVQMFNQILPQIMSDQNRAYVITGPDKENIKQPSEKDIINLIEEVSKRDIKPYEQGEQIKSLITNTPQPGKILSETTNEKLGTKTLALSNGAKVTYKVTDFKDDEILFNAISKGGLSVLDDEKYNATKWAYNSLLGGSMLDEGGLNNYSKSQLTQFLSDKVAKVSMNFSENSEGLNGNSSVKDLKVLFELIHSYFTGLNFDQEAIDAAVKKQNSMMGNIMSQPSFAFSNEVYSYLYENNPRMTGIIPFEEDWKKTDFNLAYEVYKTKFSDADDFHFYFVGNIEEESFKQYVQTYIATLPSTKDVENWKDHGYRPNYDAKEKVVKKGKDPKSMVMIMFQGETEYNDKESLAIQALGKILNIKLIEQLREEKGGVYSASARASMSKIPYGNYSINFNFPCGPENVEKLIEATLFELDKIVKNGVEEKDLNKFKEGELNDYRDNLKKNRYWLRQMTAAFMDKDKENKFLEYEKQLNALTKEEVHKVAKKYGTKNKFVAKLFPESE